MDEIDDSRARVSQPIQAAENDIAEDEVAPDDIAVDGVVGDGVVGDGVVGDGVVGDESARDDFAPVGVDLDGDFGLRNAPRSRFHASGYQFDLKTILLLFTFFSLLFLPMTLVAPQDRTAAAATLGVSFCLAIYAFALISWIPDSAMVIFLVSAPAILLALGLVVATFAVRYRM
jgi:hypothetical protein